jgi:hypothetical protein
MPLLFLHFHINYCQHQSMSLNYFGNEQIKGIKIKVKIKLVSYREVFKIAANARGLA